jgi:hypothetical protein
LPGGKFVAEEHIFFNNGGRAAGASGQQASQAEKGKA